MPSSIVREVRRECKRLGIPFAVVVDAKEVLRETELVLRERRDSVRQWAWQIVTASKPGCAPFWRHGFSVRFGKRVERSDYSVIPGYDQIHQQISGVYPEWADDEAGLFDYLLSPYERRKTSRELWWEAVALVADSPAPTVAASAATGEDSYDF